MDYSDGGRTVSDGKLIPLPKKVERIGLHMSVRRRFDGRSVCWIHKYFVTDN